MNEALVKIDELLNTLQAKINATEVLNRQLSEKKGALTALEEKAQAKLNNASAMERVYKKYVDFDAEKKSLAEKLKTVTERLLELSSKEKEVADGLKKLAKEGKELDEKKATLSKQVLALKEREENFKKKQEDLKNLISGQAIKDILK